MKLINVLSSQEMRRVGQDILILHSFIHVPVDLNNLVPSIKFTYEIENDCKIAFLDVLIYRKNNANFHYSFFLESSPQISLIYIIFRVTMI